MFAVRWLLLCVLAFGVVGMHHLGGLSLHGGGDSTSAQAADCCPDHEGGGHEPPAPMHDLLHLCLAILAAGLVLVVLLLRWHRPDRLVTLLTRRGPLPVKRAPRAPPDTATVLSSLCVFRL